MLWLYCCVWCLHLPTEWAVFCSAQSSERIQQCRGSDACHPPFKVWSREYSAAVPGPNACNATVPRSFMEALLLYPLNFQLAWHGTARCATYSVYRCWPLPALLLLLGPWMEASWRGAVQEGCYY
jgi:hypothetical protein